MKKETEAVKLHIQGLKVEEIYGLLGSEFVNTRFIERSVYEGRKTRPRVSGSALNLVDFIDRSIQRAGKVRYGLG